MAVKKSETRIPAGLVAADLGQTAATSDGKATLVSYYQSPVARNRKQSYVVLVTDATLQGQVDKYHWQVLATDVQTTEGVWEYTPAGTLTEFTLNVTLKDSGGNALGTISMQQIVASPNEDLENLVTQINTTYPQAADPVTSREVINDYLGLIHPIAPVATDSALNRLLFGISYIASQTTPTLSREQLITTLRTTLEGGDTQAASFYSQASAGVGICSIRPEVFALIVAVIPNSTTLMTIAVSGLPTFPAAQADVDRALTDVRTALATINESARIDLFNRLRFPKASLKSAKLMIDELRTRYNSGRTLDVIFGTQAEMLMLIDRCKVGPHT